MSLRRRTAPAALALLLAGACASAPGGEPAGGPAGFLAGVRARDGRLCRPARTPEPLPAPADLLDEPAFRAEAARAWHGAGRPAGHVVFSLRYDEHGLNVHRAVIESTVPAPLADSLQKLVFALRRELPAAEREWGVRLKVEPGDEPALSVARRQVCAPIPRDGGDRLLAASGISMREELFPRMGPTTAGEESVVWVRVRLDTGGNVTDARVERTLLRGSWETRILSYVRSIPFLPATEDGYPVPSETMVPVRLGR
jgi:hypothetical protein